MKAELWVDQVLETGLPLSSRADHPLRWLIADVLDEMDPFYSEPLRMWAWENMTYRAIAQELGLAGRQSAHERVKSALQVFRDVLLEELDERAAIERDPGRTAQRQLREPEGGDGVVLGQDAG